MATTTAHAGTITVRESEQVEPADVGGKKPVVHHGPCVLPTAEGVWPCQSSRNIR